MSPFFREFFRVGDVSRKAFDKFGHRLPQEYLEEWRAHGIGFVGNGFLRVLDPAELWPIFSDSVTMSEELIPLFVTAFGDMIVYHDGYYEAVMYRYNQVRQVFSARSPRLYSILEEAYTLREDLSDGLFSEASARLGVPATDECFGFFPLLSLGGAEQVSSIRRVKLPEHILLMTQMQGPVRTFTTAEIEAEA